MKKVFREVLAVVESSKEDKASRTAFLGYLKERGRKGWRLFVSDKFLGLVENLGSFIRKHGGAPYIFYRLTARLAESPREGREVLVEFLYAISAGKCGQGRWTAVLFLAALLDVGANILHCIVQAGSLRREHAVTGTVKPRKLVGLPCGRGDFSTAITASGCRPYSGLAGTE